MFLSVGHEKNVIYSKLVNNPFKSFQTYFGTEQVIRHFLILQTRIGVMYLNLHN